MTSFVYLVNSSQPDSCAGGGAILVIPMAGLPVSCTNTSCSWRFEPRSITALCCLDVGRWWSYGVMSEASIWKHVFENSTQTQVFFVFFSGSQAAVGRTFRCFNFLTTEVDSQVGGSDCFQRMKERRGLVIDTSKVEKGMDSWSVTRQPSHFSRWPCLQGSPCEQFGGGRGWRFSWNGYRSRQDDRN